MPGEASHAMETGGDEISRLSPLHLLGRPLERECERSEGGEPARSPAMHFLHRGRDSYLVTLCTPLARRNNRSGCVALFHRLLRYQSEPQLRDSWSMLCRSLHSVVACHCVCYALHDCVNRSSSVDVHVKPVPRLCLNIASIVGC